VSIHAALYHKTRYTYDRPAGHSPHVVRLRPAPHCRAAILSYSQKITGGENFINWQQDPFSNWNARVVFPEKMTELCVEVELVVEMAVHNPFDFFLEPGATHYPFTYDDALKKDLAPFLEPCARRTPLQRLAARRPRRTRLQTGRTSDFLVALNQRVQRRQVFDSPRTGRADAGGNAGRGAAPAAIPPGCWRNCSAIAAWPRVSSAAI
jgi:transglutaminase-like putative cysteine protease